MQTFISTESIRHALQDRGVSVVSADLRQFVQDNFQRLYRNPLCGESFYTVINALFDEYQAWINTPDVPELSNGWYEDNKGNLYEDFEQCIGE